MKQPGAGWHVALVLDGNYFNKNMADAVAVLEAKVLDVPYGWPTPHSWDASGSGLDLALKNALTGGK